MTIRELIKQYPKMETLALIDAGGTPFPSWSYSPDDIVIKWYIEKQKSMDITNALFNNGKIKIEYKNILVFIWKRKEKKKNV